MSLTHPACPNTACPPWPTRKGGLAPYWHRGTFERSDGSRVRRYQCTACKAWFSDQTFEPDRGLKKRAINAALRRLSEAGASIRATARLLGIDRKTARRRMRALGAAGLPWPQAAPPARLRSRTG